MGGTAGQGGTGGSTGGTSGTSGTGGTGGVCEAGTCRIFYDATSVDDLGPLDTIAFPGSSSIAILGMMTAPSATAWGVVCADTDASMYTFTCDIPCATGDAWLIQGYLPMSGPPGGFAFHGDLNWSKVNDAACTNEWGGGDHYNGTLSVTPCDGSALTLTDVPNSTYVDTLPGTFCESGEQRGGVNRAFTVPAP